ncbi:hypothetical protein LTR78_007107 [Recurvomyces mirabilis]|uniref:Major facilitator superfamily (MFS) profile domain-containing protein n=1 Tax=Recurvomyces mirabilis TaxID=574656 RepID=A0AAE0WJS0_9PEZI|nr:hypothetical protein LTR78_007107 [Recurvomyces mirabilis]KAK5150922.1 hypothetical protein LTS14_009725 [Recurvomyces mirabilis]
MSSLHRVQQIMPPIEVTADPDIEMAIVVEARPPVKPDDPYLVAFDQPSDSDNPKDWSATLKWTVTDALSATCFNRIMVSTIMAPALPAIAAELHMTSTESFMALSIYVLATAIGPLLLSPLCEIYGRKPILHASNLWFLKFNIVCGFARNKQTLIAARFLAGFGASAIFSLAAAVLGDIWRPEQRGTTLAVYSLIPLLGSAVGPIIGGIMAERTTWRWDVLVNICFPGPHGGSVTVYERLQADRNVLASIWLSFSRPLRLLATHPIVQIVAVFQAFNYGVLYIVLSSFATLWTEHYHQHVGTSGLHYIAIALGEVVGSQVAGRLMDRIFAHLTANAGLSEGESAPEWHLPLVLPSVRIVSSGLLVYGWAAAFHVHWMVVDIGAFLYSFGGQIVGQPMTAYIIDAYPEYVSSATAATRFVTSMYAFAFPLFTPAMYRVLGYGWGNTVISLAAVVLLVPAPLVLWRYGARLRTKTVMIF